jgi:hypothetical protein
MKIKFYKYGAHILMLRINSLCNVVMESSKRLISVR